MVREDKGHIAVAVNDRVKLKRLRKDVLQNPNQNPNQSPNQSPNPNQNQNQVQKQNKQVVECSRPLVLLVICSIKQLASVSFNENFCFIDYNYLTN